MSKKVVTFERVQKDYYSFLFMLVIFSDYYEKSTAELRRQADAFGADLALKGLFVEPARLFEREISNEVMAKDWPAEIRERLEAYQETMLLVIERDFDEFDPHEHPWAIIWLRDLEANPDEVKELLQSLARKTRQGDDVIAYVREAAERAERRDQTARIVRVAARAGKYIKWEPKIPIVGIGIDMKALLSDLAASA